MTYQHVARGMATPAGLAQSSNINALRWNDGATGAVLDQWVTGAGGTRRNESVETKRHRQTQQGVAGRVCKMWGML